jgi:hypothetical protein
MEPEYKTAAATAAMNAKLDGILKVISKRLPTKEEREEDRNGSDSEPSSPTGDSPKSRGFLDMIKGLGSGLGSIASSFLKFGGFLLKTAFFPITAIASMLTSTAALVAGLVAIGALFAGVAVASFMLTDKEFEELKKKIATGVAGVFSTIVEGAIDFYNKFVPDSFKISEDDKKSMSSSVFTTVKSSIMSIITFANDIIKAFAGGFSDNMKGIKTKFTDFTGKIKKVYDTVTGWVSEKGILGSGKNGLMWYFDFVGKAISKVIDSVLLIANFLADLIIDPTVTMAKLRAGISNGLASMGATISEYLSSVFSKEGIMKMMQGILGEGSIAFKALEGAMGTSMKEVSAEAAAGRKKEMERIKGRNKKREVNAARMEKELQDELAKGDDRKDATVKRLQYALDIEKGEIELAKTTLVRMNEKVKRSNEIILREKVNEKMGDALVQLEDTNDSIREKIKAADDRIKYLNESTLRADTVGVQGLTGVGAEEFSAKTFEDALSDANIGADLVKDIAAGNATLTKDMINKFVEYGFQREDIEGQENQSIVFTRALRQITRLDEKRAENDILRLELEANEKRLEGQRFKEEVKIRKSDILALYKSETGQVLNDEEAQKRAMIASRNNSMNAGSQTVEAVTNISAPVSTIVYQEKSKAGITANQ